LIVVAEENEGLVLGLEAVESLEIVSGLEMRGAPAEDGAVRENHGGSESQDDHLDRNEAVPWVVSSAVVPLVQETCDLLQGTWDDHWAP
jgi:hypothetical protein